MAEIDLKYKYLTYEEMAENVAEKALDEFLYYGRSIREWMQIIASEDCISKQAAIDLADELIDDLPDDDRLSDMVMSHNEGILEYQTQLSLLPPVTSAAEQEPCTDAISREAVLEVWGKIKKEIEHKKFRTMEVQISDAHLGFNGGLECALAIIDEHLQEMEE